jgi:sugar lactone lactonase YvrE
MHRALTCIGLVGSAQPRVVKSFSAEVASEQAYGLAEGPLWDGRRERVMWVDINVGRVHVGSLSGGVVTPSQELAFDETVGAVVSADDGRLLVAGRRSLYVVDHDDRRTVFANLVPTEKDSRLNDGACDPAGRFLVGSMSLDNRQGDDCLYIVQPDAAVATVDRDVTLSNGLGWSPDGSVFYNTDTVPGIIWARPYDAARGTWGRRAEALRVTGGVPDGICVDTDGRLWVAIWGAGQVRCYTPTGDWVATVHVPAPNTSSAAFVGPRRDTLLITTAGEQLSAPQQEKFPLSGHLFSAHVGAIGVPATPWRYAASI